MIESACASTTFLIPPEGFEAADLSSYPQLHLKGESSNSHPAPGCLNDLYPHLDTRTWTSGRSVRRRKTVSVPPTRGGCGDCNTVATQWPHPFVRCATPRMPARYQARRLPTGKKPLGMRPRNPQGQTVVGRRARVGQAGWRQSGLRSAPSLARAGPHPAPSPHLRPVGSRCARCGARQVREALQPLLFNPRINFTSL